MAPGGYGGPPPMGMPPQMGGFPSGGYGRPPDMHVFPVVEDAT